MQSIQNTGRARGAAVSRTLRTKVAVKAVISAAPQTRQIAQVQSLQDVLAHKKYKAVLLDQFGVLHDGQVPYPEAIDATRRLAEAGVKLYIISNSSRRSSGTLDKLAGMGFDKGAFAGAVTSGELAHRYLLNRPSDWWKTLGRRVLHITWGARGAVSLDGLNLEVVDWPEEADFILAHGTEALGSAWNHPVRPMNLEKLQQVLVRCVDTSRVRQRPLPMVVANPDVVTVSGTDLIVMPGTLARQYKELGGQVVIMGKPDPVIYKAALEDIMEQPEQVLAVGDSLEHDIAGAVSAGIDSLFVAGGIHANELGVPGPDGARASGAPLDSDKLGALCEQHAVAPTYACSYVRW